MRESIDADNSRGNTSKLHVLDFYKDYINQTQ